MMKNILLNFLKSFWAIIITAGIIFAADLSLNSGDVITTQKWSDLVTEINSLKTQISDNTPTVTERT